MKRKNMTRNALVTSIISLLLCVSMLVGTTFAWFTDEVVSGRNTIAAGNLDIELLANGTPVESSTKLFDDVTLWEPGAVVYENLQVKNVGTLALKYQMTMNFGNENDLNGHKLSEVLKVAVIDKIADGATRQQVLEAAKASEKLGTLSNFYLTGELEANTAADEKTVVIFWAPNDNATDNLYNANNGQKTSDGEPLHIEFGITLKATQKMSEEDSFGKDYDEFSSILPKATVNNVTAQYGTIKTTVNGWGGNEENLDLDLDLALQFQPNESYDEALTNSYKYWNVDFVVKADQDMPADSMALAGYYQLFCDMINDGNWVTLTNTRTEIEAGTEIRLVEMMGQGSIKVSYKDICQYGNDGIGFLCGAVDLTGENAGTTITVELRMYETTSDPNGSSNDGTETGNYEVVGVYTYTFANEVATADELKAQLAAGNDVKLTADLELDADETVKIASGKDVTIDLAGHTIATVSDATGANRNAFDVNGGTLTVKNGTVTTKHTGDNMGWNNSTNVFNVTNGGVLNIENATVENNGGSDMAFGIHLNNWGEVTLNITNSTIKSTYCPVRVFNSGNDMNNVTIKNSTLNSTAGNRALWVHNYTEADFDGSAEKAAAHAELLNFDIYGNGNTFVAANNENPILYGFTNSIRFTAEGVQVQ